MRLLLDTNILLWATSSPDRLDEQTSRLVEDRSNTVLFSAASVWEIAIKAGQKRDDFAFVPAQVLAAALATGFVELPVRSTVAADVAELPHHHRDPFDRLIIAQAMAEAVQVITTDHIFSRYTDLVLLVERRNR